MTTTISHPVCHVIMGSIIMIRLCGIFVSDGMILGTIPGMVGTDLITVTAGTVGAAGDGVGDTAILAGTTVGVQAGIMVGRLQHLHAHIVPEAVL